MTQKLRQAGFDPARVTQVAALLMTLVGGAFFFAPLRHLPADMENAEDTQHEIQITLTKMGGTLDVHTEALQTLAQIADETDALDDEVNDHARDIQHIKRRLDHLEQADH